MSKSLETFKSWNSCRLASSSCFFPECSTFLLKNNLLDETHSSFLFRSILSLLLQFLRAVDCQKLDANKTKTPPIKKQINFNFITIVCPSKLWEVFGTFKVSLLLLLLSSCCCCFRLMNFDSVVVLFFFDQSRDDFFCQNRRAKKKSFSESEIGL